jgi:hypothetical protein
MRAAVPLSLILLGGCNSYDLFAMSGFFPGYWPPKADVLFVIDNSRSMVDESVALAEASGTLATELDDLAQSVKRNAESSTTFPDYQFSIATMDAGTTRGALIGDAPFFRRGESGLDAAFETTLLCDTTCFPDELPPTLTSDDLDALCGDNRWRNNCGGEKEEALETVFLAMCRAVPDPPEACFDLPAMFSEADRLANDGLLRDDSVFIPILVTDEGDASRRMSQLDVAPSAYNNLFKRFQHQMAWAVIGPSLDEDRLPRCTPVANSWGVLRYDFITETTGGVKVNIHSPTCAPGNLEEGFSRIANLIGGRSLAFPLRGPAIEDTILVVVDGNDIAPTVKRDPDPYGFPDFGDGWSYAEDPPTVILHGDAAPEPGTDVQIWYKPAPLE